MDKIAQGMCGVEMKSVYKNLRVLVYKAWEKTISCEGKWEDRAIDVGRNQKDVVSQKSNQ